ncbi:MAG TPA: rRNA maturation RNase YbeY [Pseudobdellovibrionaceae bacterium]|jgi:probable rRNA maturation factor
MKILVINQSSVRTPRKFIEAWILQLQKEFLKRKIFDKNSASKELTLVFLNPKEAKATNKQFRSKAYATDVLSFDGMSPDSLGELILCPQVLQKQAKVHGLKYQEELGYMILHGILHLLGYDHETGVANAEEMFGIQDEVFAKLLK